MLNKVNKAKLFCGIDCKINDKITIHSPKVGDIIEYGEDDYFSMIYGLCATPYEVRDILWDKYNVDWNNVTDFEYFMDLASRSSTQKELEIIISGIDLLNAKKVVNTQNGNIVLYDEENDSVIDELLYEEVVGYLKLMHGIVPETLRTKAANKFTAKAMIDEARRKQGYKYKE